MYGVQVPNEKKQELVTDQDVTDPKLEPLEGRDDSNANIRDPGARLGGAEQGRIGELSIQPELEHIQYSSQSKCASKWNPKRPQHSSKK